MRKNFLIILCVMAHSLYAQNLSVTVTRTDATPLAYASIALAGQGIIASTDESGHAVLEASAGTDLLVVQADGYAEYRGEVTIPSSVDIVLSPLSTSVEMIVSAPRETGTVSSGELALTPSLDDPLLVAQKRSDVLTASSDSLGGALSVLNNASAESFGVDIPAFSAPSFRGFSPGSASNYLEGALRLPFSSYSLFFIPRKTMIFPAKVFSSMEIMPAVDQTALGPGAGLLINLRLPDTQPERISVSSEVSLSLAEAQLSVPLPLDGGVLVSLRKSWFEFTILPLYFSVMPDMILNLDYPTAKGSRLSRTDGSGIADGLIHLFVKPLPGLVVSADAFGALSKDDTVSRELAFDIPFVHSDVTNQSFVGGLVKTALAPVQSWDLSASVGSIAYLQDRLKSLSAELLDPASSHVVLSSLLTEAHLDGSWRGSVVGMNTELRAGSSVAYWDMKYALSDVESADISFSEILTTREYTSSSRALDIGLYAEPVLQADNLRVSVPFRADYYDTLSAWYLSPTVKAAYSPRADWVTEVRGGMRFDRMDYASNLLFASAVGEVLPFSGKKYLFTITDDFIQDAPSRILFTELAQTGRVNSQPFSVELYGYWMDEMSGFSIQDVQMDTEPVWGEGELSISPRFPSKAYTLGARCSTDIALGTWNVNIDTTLGMQRRYSTVLDSWYIPSSDVTSITRFSIVQQNLLLKGLRFSLDTRMLVGIPRTPHSVSTYQDLDGYDQIYIETDLDKWNTLRELMPRFICDMSLAWAPTRDFRIWADLMGFLATPTYDGPADRTPGFTEKSTADRSYSWSPFNADMMRNFTFQAGVSLTW